MWLTIVGIIMGACGLAALKDAHDMYGKSLCWAATILAGALMVVPLIEKPTDEYYMPAEIAVQSELNTYFVSESGDVYVHENRIWFDDDSPYLLCMDTMGTAYAEDDEILVVWRTE